MVTPANMKPYVIFGQDKRSGEKLDDMEKINARINKITDDIAGVRKGIVNKAITMEVYSNSCPDLTLIDLPGIAKVPLKGSDHGEDIEEVTKNMARSYCSDEMTIILCVIQANMDLATSDALQMARKIDPNGERTLGVLTKIDLMDRGTDALKILTNEEIPLRYGYVAVKGRSQQDIKSGMTITDGLKAEKDFFAKHPVYSKIADAQEILGIEALTFKLSSILNKHIKKNLPAIVAAIREKMEACDTRLNQLGMPLPIATEAKMNIIWSMINNYVTSYSNAIKGKYNKLATIAEEGEPISASMRKSFFSLFYNFYETKKEKEKLDLSNYLEDKQIEQAFINYEGNAFPGFPSFGGFLSLVHPFIDRLYEPVSEIVDNIYYSLENASKKIINTIFSSYPTLEDIVTDLSGKILQKQRDIAKEMSQNILDSERGYIFTSDSDFVIKFGGILPVGLYLSFSRLATRHLLKRRKNFSSSK